VLLHPGENSVTSEQVEVVAQGRVQVGTLHLTNRRLVFETHYWAGVGPSGWQTVFDVPLVQISTLRTAPSRDGRHTLRIETHAGWAYNLATPSAQRWADTLYRWRTAATPPPPSTSDQPPLAPPPPDLFTNLPPPDVYLHCRRCGGLTGMGRSNCTNCGAPL
jgi:hypothetical protein